MSDIDPFIHQLLVDTPVPEHAPDFWSSLAEQMDALDRPVPLHAVHAPTPPMSPDDVKRDRDEVRRLIERPAPSWVRRAVIVAAAAGIVGAVIAGLRSPDDDRSAVTADEPPVSVSSVPTAAQNEAVATATRFIDALGAEDVAQAATLLGPLSEQYINATAGPVEAFLRDAATSYGAWARSADRKMSAVEVRTGEFVVVIRGTRTMNGESTSSADAIPVRHAESADAWFVEPWAFDAQTGGRIELVHPDPSAGVPVLGHDEAVEMAWPVPGRIWFGFDSAVAEAAVPGSPGATISWRPTDARVGTHLLVVVYETEKTFTAFTRVIEVAG
jgi:negative regulator of sigma E activity